MLMVFQIAPATAQSTAAVMVGNLEDGGTTQTGLRNESLAQSFRTGSVAVTLESVRVPTRACSPEYRICTDSRWAPEIDERLFGDSGDFYGCYPAGGGRWTGDWSADPSNEHDIC